MSEFIKLIADPRMYRDLLFIMIPLSLSLVIFMFFRYRAQTNIIFNVFKHGIWCSTHERVHSGPTRDYFDADLFLSEPDNIDSVLKWFLEEFNAEHARSGRIDRMVFVERPDGPVGALSLKDLFSLRTKTPSAVVRPKRKGPALRVKFVNDGLVTPGIGSQNLFKHKGCSENIVLVSDVATTGTSIEIAAKMVRQYGGSVRDAFVLYDGEEKNSGPSGPLPTAEEKLRAQGISLASMFKASELNRAMDSSRKIKEMAVAKGYGLA
jgi:hypothetical protein